jgi:hypothetical protein
MSRAEPAVEPPSVRRVTRLGMGLGVVSVIPAVLVMSFASGPTTGTTASP